MKSLIGTDPSKLNNTLTELKIIPQISFVVENIRQITDRNGVVWHYTTVSCQLALRDTESEDTTNYTALGASTDIMKAQEMAREMAWRVALGAMPEIVPVIEPEIIVETPESKLITSIKAMWRWKPEELITWVNARFAGRQIVELNVTELTVLENELKGYGR